MGAQEIKLLRQQGKLDEALKMALDELLANPNSIWQKRSLCWVYDAYCDKYAESGDLKQFKVYFEKIVETIDVMSEQMLCNALCWRLRALLDVCCAASGNKNNGTICDEVFAMCKAIAPEKPSDGYSALLQEFDNNREGWSGFIAFCQWWGLDYFKEDDYSPKELKNGKKMPVSLVEKIYLGYMKCLIELNDKEEISRFMPLLDKMMGQHPEMMYLGYYKGKLLLLLGDTTHVLSSLIPFAKKKINEFWIWQLLAEAVGDDDERELACLLRSVNCKTREDFLVKVRMQLAVFLAKRGDYAGAKTQLDKYIKCMEANEWRVSSEAMAMTRQDWYKNATGKPNYLSVNYMKITNEILCDDIEDTFVVITHVNKEKEVVSAMYDKQKTCFFKYKQLGGKFFEGALFQVKFERIKEGGYANALAAKAIDEMPPNSFLKQIKGKVKARQGDEYGFINDIFIPNSLFIKHNLSNGCDIEATVIYDFNRKKNQWGWRCVKIFN